ncbi:MAG: ATPase [Planctomycetota bacterium]|nr:MAG: ATPase [Planctomycetota bacterium]
MSRIVRIANGQGFWGDSILGPVRLLREGPLDYLTLDYLAEVTMSILQKQKARRPERGYATDFVAMLDRLLPEIVEKGVKVIANAGGVNPPACVEAVLQVANKHGIAGLKVAMIEGDDILPKLDELVAGGEELRNMDTGEALSTVRDRVESANVYLGAAPIVEALEQGAQIIIGGRVSDPSLVMAPMIHEFGWAMDDWDRLGASTVAGHILECGAQCTGGNFSDWRRVPDLARVGYPIVEAEASGDFVVTKHEGTGGLVDLQVVTSQLVYEMGDPRCYIGPDVISDFTSIHLEQEGPNRVRVSGVRGAPATDTYKVSISYRDGFKALGQLTVAGPDAVAKAELCERIVFERLALDGVEFRPEQITSEFVGTGVCHRGITKEPEEPAELVLRLGVRDQDAAKLNRFGSEIVPLVTSGPPGVTGFAGGRPKAQAVIGYWPALMDKGKVHPQVTVRES